MKALTYCIIDDDDVHQFTVSRTLQLKNIAKKILTFSDGQQALEFFTSNLSNQDVLPDIIFLDINMPIMDGWQFLHEYKKLIPMLAKRIHIYLVSSSVDPRDLKKAEEIDEITKYLVKPIPPDLFDTLAPAYVKVAQ